VSKNVTLERSEMAAALSVAVQTGDRAILAPVNADADLDGLDQTVMNHAVRATTGTSAKRSATARMLRDVIT
jgi:hypothetical protein